MTMIRTIAMGAFAAALGTAAVWAPAAGQPVPGSAAQPEVPDPTAGPPALMHQRIIGVAGPTSQGQSQVSRLAKQYAKATREDEKRDLKKKLTELLGQQFDQLADQQKTELADLEKQVAELKATLNKRHDNRDTIIDRRLDQVIQEAEGLGWGIHATPSQATPTYFAPRTNGARQER